MTESLINGLRSSYAYKALETYYLAIPGNNLPEKISAIAFRIFKTAPWIAGAYILYPWVSKKIQPGSFSWFLLSLIPYAGLSFNFVYVQKVFVDTMKTGEAPSSLSQHLIQIATIYQFCKQMVLMVVSLSSTASENSEGSPIALPIQIPDEPYFSGQYLTDLQSLSQILDDCGLTYEDYAVLDCYLGQSAAADDCEPPSLKERVAYYLNSRGLLNGPDLIQRGIIPPSPNREIVTKNLWTQLNQGTLWPEQTPSAPLSTIKKTERIATAAFNLLLTLGTLALQLKYRFRSTLIGVGIGFLLKDSYLSVIHKSQQQTAYQWMTADKEEKLLKITNFSQKQIEQIDLLLISLRSQKTALTTPTPTAHKCRQIWESWNLLALSIAQLGGPFSFIGGISQGQTLASYWKSFYEKRDLLFPTGSSL